MSNYPLIEKGQAVSLHCNTGTVYHGRVEELYSGFVLLHHESGTLVHVRQASIEAVEVHNE